ncbi:hypothetical protein ISCGN_008477 [Ixodes scapularis]
MMLTVARKTTSRFKTTCPVLYHCSCYIYRNKAVVKCPGGRKQSMNADQLTSDLARFASTEMDEVTVDHFRFTTLPANLARNLTMTSLIITNGPLDAMDDECFEGVLAMDKLIVERTKLKMVPGAVLRLGSKLRELRLANNSIESVGDVLRTLVNLEKLDLDSNAIESLDESLFNNLGLLKELRLGNNKLHRLPIESLKIPPLEIVELHNNALTEETANAFGSFHRLKVLLLQQNNIWNIDQLSSRNASILEFQVDHNPLQSVPKFGSWKRLRWLGMNNCNISEVHPQAFEKLYNVEVIHLSNNNISFLNESIFHQKSKLATLNAEGNAIRSLKGVFSRTQALLALQLSMNKVQDITDTFTNLSTLVVLNLTMNEIAFIRDGTFLRNSDLAQLYISQNRIEWLGTGCFEGLSNLQDLQLQNNRIFSLNGSLRQLTALKRGILNDNLLQVIERRDFDNVPALRTLYASGNNISAIESGAFESLNNLQTLSLSFNQLVTIPRRSFPASLDKLDSLVIHGNPIVCDCRLSWLIATWGTRSPDWAICQGPPRFRGRLLYDLTPEKLKAWPQGCDANCTCECHDDEVFGMDIRVSCANESLEELPSTFPTETAVLDLSGNRLRQLDDDLADRSPNLRSLNLANNRLAKFPTDLVSKMNLSSVWLSGNPWSCDCEDYAFTRWAGTIKGVVSKADVSCFQDVQRAHPHANRVT